MTETAAPADLAAAGRKLWESITAQTALTTTEAALLCEACRATDELDTLRAAATSSELITAGSTGQPVVNRLWDEVRKHRDSVARLLGQLGVVVYGEGSSSPSDRQRQARQRALANSVKANGKG